MKVRNAYRPTKIAEIARIKKQYEINFDLTLDEQLDAVILELEDKVDVTKDQTQRASINEYAKVFEGLFVDENGRPTEIGKYIMNCRVGRRRRLNEKEHPYEKYYKLRNIERDVHGVDIVRYYLAIIAGKKEVAIVNSRLERERERLKEIEDGNEDANDVKAVRKSRKEHLQQLRNKRRNASVSAGIA